MVFIYKSKLILIILIIRFFWLIKEEIFNLKLLFNINK